MLVSKGFDSPSPLALTCCGRRALFCPWLCAPALCRRNSEVTTLAASVAARRAAVSSGPTLWIYTRHTALPQSHLHQKNILDKGRAATTCTFRVSWGSGMQQIIAVWKIKAFRALVQQSNYIRILLVDTRLLNRARAFGKSWAEKSLLKPNKILT